MRHATIFAFSFLFLITGCQIEPKQVESEQVEPKKEPEVFRDTLVAHVAQRFATHTKPQNSSSRFQISGTVFFEDNGLSEVKVIVVQDGEKFEEKTTDAKGKYELSSLPASSNYEIRFSKPGYCTKFAAIEGIDPVADITGDFPLEISLSLFALSPKDRIKYNFMEKEPASISRYDPKTDNMIWDMERIAAFKKKVDAVK